MKNPFDKTTKGIKLQAIKKILNASVPLVHKTIPQRKPSSRVGKFLNKIFKETLKNFMRDKKEFENASFTRDTNFERMIQAYRNAFVYIADTDGAYRGHLAYMFQVITVEYTLMVNKWINGKGNEFLKQNEKKFVGFQQLNRTHVNLLFYLWFTEAKFERVDFRNMSIT